VHKKIEEKSFTSKGVHMIRGACLVCGCDRGQCECDAREPGLAGILLDEFGLSERILAELHEEFPELQMDSRSHYCEEGVAYEEAVYTVVNLPRAGKANGQVIKTLAVVFEDEVNFPDGRVLPLATEADFMAVRSALFDLYATICQAEP